MTVYFSTKSSFSSAHRVFREDWSVDQNYKAFGKCANPNYHGHNYILWVTVKATLAPELGTIVNKIALDQVIQDQVIAMVDHQNLSDDVALMEHKMASTEYVALRIGKNLQPAIQELGATLHKIEIIETKHNAVEVFF